MELTTTKRMPEFGASEIEFRLDRSQVALRKVDVARNDAITRAEMAQASAKRNVGV
jgi:hypothetical protein